MGSVAGWQDGTWSRKVMRQVFGAVFGGKTSARPLGAQSGVTSPVDLTVTSSDWTVGAFTGVLDVESDATMGPSPFEHDGDTGGLTPASGSIVRWDLLSLTMADPSTEPTIVYTAGTSASTLPTTPPNSIPLAKITVPKSGTGSPSIALIAPRAYAAGAVAACTSSASYPTDPYVGQYIDDAALGLLRWDGGQWNSILTADTGWINLTGVVGGWTAANLQARQIGNRVQLRGTLTNSSFSGTFTLVATLPSGIAAPPVTSKVWDVSGAAATSQRAVLISTTGDVSIFANSASSAACHLDFSYLTD